MTINNVNYNKNPQYFYGNDASEPNGVQYPLIEADGFTTKLVATGTPIKGEWNTIKLGIADVSDRILDSYVLLAANSLSCVQRSEVPSTSPTAQPSTSHLPTIQEDEYQCLAIEQSNLATGLFAISDSECEVCADGYEFWPCNVSPQLCVCGTTFTSTPSKSPTAGPSQSPSSGPSQGPSNEVRVLIYYGHELCQVSFTFLFMLNFSFNTSYYVLVHIVTANIEPHSISFKQP